MLNIQEISDWEHKPINEVVQIHLDTFTGFFLTFMGRGFLKQMYSAYCRHDKSGLYVAFDNGRPVGFLAYSADMSGLYKHMLKTRLIPFAWYAFGAFLRRPKAFFRIIRAFLKPAESKRTEVYIELSSIGVSPEGKNQGIGSQLIQKLIAETDFEHYAYIALETDADNNEGANRFYQKNGFVCIRTYETPEHRRMHEYRFSPKEMTQYEAPVHTQCS